MQIVPQHYQNFPTNELSPDYLLRTFHLFPLVFVAAEKVAVVAATVGAFFAAVGSEVLVVVDVEALSAGVADSIQKYFQIHLT